MDRVSNFSCTIIQKNIKTHNLIFLNLTVFFYESLVNFRFLCRKHR
uniref:Uncharacterized protein n=1 Tax=Klebsiella pneumoniae TaxID=573 RepID=A0A8B0SSA3_KLEPN|nr:hypothetical protein [Klebsiella pneumoniae]